MLITVLAFTVSCAKRKFYRNIESSWSTYELIYKDGNVQNGRALDAMTIFGLYDPHIKFESNKSYVPFSRSAGEVVLKTAEAGKYSFTSKDDELRLSGGWKDITFVVEKLEDGELWLRSPSLHGGALVRLKRD